MEGIKHIIECHCMLPQYKNNPNPIFHKFIVFSEIDDSDTVVPKYAQCNNCGVIHKIIDVRRSEIMAGKEELASITTVDDIKLMIKQDVGDVLELYSCELPMWEHALFILQEKKWGSFIILKREIVDDETHGKLLRFESLDKFKIESFIDRSIVERELF